MKTQEKLNMTMLCDFYELTMGNGYFEAGCKERITYFDVFFRKVPDGGGFAIAAGLEQLIDYIENLHFTEEDIAAYYNAHKAEFKLDRPLVKGRIVRFPVNHRQSFKLRELVKASSADRLQDLADICAKNDFELKEFAEWTPWSDFAANLPLRQGMASEQLIRPGEVQQLRDNESHYYFFVTEVAGSGQTAPLETRRATIRRILFNLRQAEVIRSHEEELVDAALTEGEAKIYGNRNN